MIAVGAGLVALLLVAGVWLALRPRKTDLKREVVVHTKNDRSIRGVLVDEDRNHLWLADARYLHEAQEHEVGRVRVPKSNEDFTQVLDA